MFMNDSIIVLDDPSHCTRKYINISLINTIQFIQYFRDKYLFAISLSLTSILITLACTHVYVIKTLSKSVAQIWVYFPIIIFYFFNPCTAKKIPCQRLMVKDSRHNSKWLPVKSMYRPIFPSYILYSQKKRYVRNTSRNIHYNTCEGDTQLFPPSSNLKLIYQVTSAVLQVIIYKRSKIKTKTLAQKI